MIKQFKTYIKKYKHQLLIKFIQSRFLKTKVNFLLIMGLTMIFQLHINIILCYIFLFDPYIDFVIQIIITILIGLYTKYFLNFVLLFEQYIYAITKYFIHNYSLENYRRWKRNLILFLCFYAILILLFYELEKFKVILQVIQTIISFLILDQIQASPIAENLKIKTIKTINPNNNCITYTKVYRKGDLKIKME